MFYSEKFLVGDTEFWENANMEFSYLEKEFSDETTVKLSKFQDFLWRIKYEKSKCCLTVFHRGSYAKAVTPTNRKSLNCNRDIRELAMVISHNIMVRNRQMRFVKWFGSCIGLYTRVSNRDIGVRGKCNGTWHLEAPTRVKRREGLREVSYLRWRVSIVALSHKCYNIRWV